MKRLPLTKGLAWLSIGLGLAQLLAPKRVSQAAGIKNYPGALRAVGIRELITGAGLLTRTAPKAGAWARVAGDVMDVALLANAKKRLGKQRRFGGTLGTVLALGLLDSLSARKLSKH